MVNIKANHYKRHVLFGHEYSLIDHGDMTEVFIIHPETLTRNSWFTTTIHGEQYRSPQFRCAPYQHELEQLNTERARNFFIGLENQINKDRQEFIHRYGQQMK